MNQVHHISYDDKITQQDSGTDAPATQGYLQGTSSQEILLFQSGRSQNSCQFFHIAPLRTGEITRNKYMKFIFPRHINIQVTIIIIWMGPTGF